MKPAVHDTCFPARLLLAELESCHRIGCDTDSTAIKVLRAAGLRHSLDIIKSYP